MRDALFCRGARSHWRPTFTDAEWLALAGFRAGYRGLTREAYTLDLRQFTGWCRARSLPLFSVRRAEIETFARELEAEGRARATVTRRLCTIAGFYKYAVEEELLDHSPAAHMRRPRLDYESHATTLDRNELGAPLVAAGLGPPAGHALVSLLAPGTRATPYPRRVSAAADTRPPVSSRSRRAGKGWSVLLILFAITVWIAGGAVACAALARRCWLLSSWAASPRSLRARP